MSLNVSKGTLTQPGAIGNQTISLPANFDPKAIVVWGVNRAAAGDSTSTDPVNFGIGAGTYRAGAVSQWFCGCSGESGDQAAIHTAALSGTDALLKMHGVSDLDVAAPTIDFELDLVSMQTGATSNVIVNWANLHPTAGLIVHYMIFGGSDVTDALAGSVTRASATTQDVTVAAGFGQPDLIMMAENWEAAGNLGNVDANVSIGWGNKALEQCCHDLASFDTATVVQMAHYQRADRIVGVCNANGGTLDYDGQLAAVAGWPTDGYRLTWSSAVGGDAEYFLALKGTFQSKIGQSVSPTTAGAQDNACGFTPSAAFVWGGNLPAATVVNTTDASLGMQWVGGWDGTNGGGTAWSDDDANASQRGRVRHQTTNILVQLANTSGAIAILTAATASASGNNLRLTFTTVNPTGRAYLWMALASAPAGGAGLTQGIDDTLSVADNIAPAAGYIRAIAESSLSPSDSLALASAVQSLIQDSLGLTDALTSARGIFPSTIGDTLNVIDAITSMNLGKELAIPDTLGLADSLSTVSGKGVTIPDTLGLADAIATLSAYIRQFDDSAAAVDNLSTALGFNRNIADPVAVADAITTLAAYTRTIADTLTVADAQTILRGLVQLINEASLAISDNVTPVTATPILRTINESSLPVADNLNRSIGFGRILADVIAVADNLAKQIAAQRILDDSLAVVDGTSFQWNRALVIADLFDLADELQTTSTYERTIDDSLALQDALATLVQLAPQLMVYLQDQAVTDLLLAEMRLTRVLAQDRPTTRLTTGARRAP